MKSKSIKKILILAGFLIVTALVVIGGIIISNQNAAPDSSNAAVFSVTKTEFPIFLYHVQTVEDYPTVRDLGFNLVDIAGLEFYTDSEINKALSDMDAALKNHLQVYLSIRRADKATIQNFVKKVKDHPALYGYILPDEPELIGYSATEVKSLSDNVREIDSVHPQFLNFAWKPNESQAFAGIAEITGYDNYPYIGTPEQTASNIAYNKSMNAALLKLHPNTMHMILIQAIGSGPNSTLKTINFPTETQIQDYINLHDLTKDFQGFAYFTWDFDRFSSLKAHTDMYASVKKINNKYLNYPSKYPVKIYDTNQISLCTSYNYSNWAACKQDSKYRDGVQTRTLSSRVPEACYGTPRLIQECHYEAPVCTEWTYSDWEGCRNGVQERKILTAIPAGCNGGPAYVLKLCDAPPNSPPEPQRLCTNFTYSAWSACNNGTQTRTVATRLPSGCSGGNPVTSQSCTSVQILCTSYTYSTWSACSNGTQTRTVATSAPSGCVGGTPITSQSCSEAQTQCTSFTYSAWSACNNGTQTRTVATRLPTGCSSGNPVTSQSCTTSTPAATECTSFTYSPWGSCTNGTQTRTVVASVPSGCTGGSPTTSQSCTVIIPAACGAMDSNGDNKLDIIDFANFARKYNNSCNDNPTVNACGKLDGNSDGKIDITDFANFARKFGKTCGS